MVSPGDGSSGDGAGAWLFQLGTIVATPTALAALPREDIQYALGRHVSGDWGIMSKQDRRANDLAVAAGTHIVSAYLSSDGRKFWVITEADRSATTVFLPEDN